MSIELTKYDPLRAEVAALRETNASLVFIYTDPAGNKNARSHIYKLRNKKGDIEWNRCWKNTASSRTCPRRNSPVSAEEAACGPDETGACGIERVHESEVTDGLDMER